MRVLEKVRSVKYTPERVSSVQEKWKYRRTRARRGALTDPTKGAPGNHDVHKKIGAVYAVPGEEAASHAHTASHAQQFNSRARPPRVRERAARLKQHAKRARPFERS